MAEETLLDQAHAAMEAAPDDETLRLRFYERLADAELYLLLQEEANGNTITPEVFEIDDATFVLTFDREARMTDFTGRSVPYVALSGRSIFDLLAQGGLGLGLNLDVAPSAFLMPPSGVAWMSETLAQQADELEQEVEIVFPPHGLPETLIAALDTKLATAGGLAEGAYLVGSQYKNGVRGHLLAFVDAVPGAEIALTQAVHEVLSFSGLEAISLDVGFFQSHTPVVPLFAKEGLRFDLPKPEQPKELRAPGSDPSKPPILK